MDVIPISYHRSQGDREMLRNLEEMFMRIYWQKRKRRSESFPLPLEEQKNCRVRRGLTFRKTDSKREVWQRERD